MTKKASYTVTPVRGFDRLGGPEIMRFRGMETNWRGVDEKESANVFVEMKTVTFNIKTY